MKLKNLHEANQFFQHAYQNNQRGAEIGDMVVEYLVEQGVPRDHIYRPYSDYIMVFGKIGMTFHPSGKIIAGGIELDINNPNSFPKILQMVKDSLR